MQVDGRLGKAISHVNHLFELRNPFWADDSDVQRVVALELPWSAIVGIDYRCPLHDDGTIVLEAKQLIKRTFKSVDGVQQFYASSAGPAASAPRNTVPLRAFLSETHAPCSVPLPAVHQQPCAQDAFR